MQAELHPVKNISAYVQPEFLAPNTPDGDLIRWWSLEGDLSYPTADSHWLSCISVGSINVLAGFPKNPFQRDWFYLMQS